MLFDLERKLGCEWDDRWAAQVLVAFAGILRTLAEIGAVVSGFEGPVEVGRHKGPRFRVSFHSFCGCYTAHLHFFGTTRYDCVFFSSGGETVLEALEMTVAKVLAASG